MCEITSNYIYFKDIKMNNVVDDFLTELKFTLNSRRNPVTKTFIDTVKYSIRRIFSNVSLNDISKDLILEIFKTTNFKANDQINMIRFVTFLCENQIINDLYLTRLVKFKYNLNRTMANMDDIINLILTSKYYSKYEDYGLFETEDGTALFYNTDINKLKNKIYDSRFLDILNDYIADIILNNNGIISAKIKYCISIKHIFPTFFSNILIEELNIENITKVFRSVNRNDFKSWEYTEIYRFLIYLIDNDMVNDKKLKYLSDLKSYFLMGAGGSSTNDMIKIFDSDDIEKYYIVINIKKSKVKRMLLYINIDNYKIRKAYQEFSIQYRRSNDGFLLVSNHFNLSLKNCILYNVESLDYNTYLKQLNYFTKLSNKNAYATITAFYLFIYQNYNIDIFKKQNINPRILIRAGIGMEIAEGYVITLYNPMEQYPMYDKWLLYYGNVNYTNASIQTIPIFSIDFTKIECKIYREWAKNYVWNFQNDIHVKIKNLYQITLFVNYILDLKKGKKLSIYTRPTENLNISVNEIVAYKQYLLSILTNHITRKSNLNRTKSFLNFINSNGLAVIDKASFYHLSYNASNSKDNTEAIPVNDLNTIAKLLKYKALESILNSIYYAIFYISLETEFRSSQICNLTTDCIIETSKVNEYSILSQTKTSHGEKLLQPITIYVKRQLEEIIKLTSEYRNQCINKDISKYIFIYPGQKNATFKIISTYNFNIFFKSCCRELKIKEYTLSNLRDTHMTMAEEYVIRNSLSSFHQSVLSGHTNTDTDTKYYIDTKITNLLESVHGIIIGNVSLEGEIVQSICSDIANHENSVSNECGYCKSKYCNNLTYLDCILCKDFITTIDRIPYFEEQIIVINEKIRQACIPHDKEDCINIKLLLVSYLKELYKLKGVEIIE